MKLCDVEDFSAKEGPLKADEVSGLRNTLLVKAIETERLAQWMVGDQVNLTVEQFLLITNCRWIFLIFLVITFNDDSEVQRKAAEHLYKNLAQFNDGQRFVVKCIKRPLRQYVESL